MFTLKTIGFICFLLVLIFFERLIPFRRLPLFRTAFFSDLGWYPIVQNQLLNIGVFGFLYQLPPKYHFNVISGQPLWLQFVIMFLLFDIMTYWMHRWVHYYALMWRFHELHHSSTEIDWLSGLRNHAVDSVAPAVLNVGFYCLLGADIKIIGMVFAVVTIHGIYKHANIKHKIGWLQYIIISTEMHRMHHLNEMKYQESNYGTVLSIWDWMFKTGYYPDEEKSKNIPYGTDNDFPQNFIRGNIHVFRKLK